MTSPVDNLRACEALHIPMAMMAQRNVDLGAHGSKEPHLSEQNWQSKTPDARRMQMERLSEQDCTPVVS